MRYPSWIDGAARETGDLAEVRSPYTGEVVGEVGVAGPEDMDAAITAATRAFETTRRMPTHERAAVLEGVAAGIRGRAEELARLMARESGKPIKLCRGEVARAVVTFTLGADAARSLDGEVLPIDLQARAEGRLCLTTRVPRGPVAAISPFNFPLNLIAHKVSPAVAAGCSVVLKPPPQAPLTGHVLAEVCAEAGLPPGALNVVHCAPETAQRMVEDERPRVLSFTGSDRVGWRLKGLAGKKQVLLELGGNAPCVIDEGVDLDAVTDEVLLGAWAHAGQVCIKVQRLYVHQDLYGPFLERFVAATRGLRVGDPLDEETLVGPLIEPQHVERVQAWIAEAVEAGAQVHTGGEAQGQVLPPHVLTGVDPRAKVCTEEVFGPVTVVEPFGRFEEALEACNATRFGLQAGVFTRDVGRALQAYRELDYGGVLINELPTFRVDNFPYGGTKDSGFGREGVRYAVEEMTEPKVLILGGLQPAEPRA